MTRTAAMPTERAGTASSASAWEALFGCPPPQRLPSLVERAVAWREQVLLHGDVSPAIAHDLQLAAEHAINRRGADHPSPVVSDPQSCIAAVENPADNAVHSSAKKAASSRAAALPPAASQLLPGSRLVKEHGGRNHVVTVEDSGFRYEGELFTSLSAIAKHITGTHWNGLLFFGLRKRRSYPPKPRRHG